ncbi:hypothetical protein VIGAN_02343100, partial [Vigna angularis var. angularis]
PNALKFCCFLVFKEKTWLKAGTFAVNSEGYIAAGSFSTLESSLSKFLSFLSLLLHFLFGNYLLSLTICCSLQTLFLVPVSFSTP